MFYQITTVSVPKIKERLLLMLDEEPIENNQSIGRFFYGLLIFFVVMMVVLTVIASVQALNREEAQDTETLESCAVQLVLSADIANLEHRERVLMELNDSNKPSTLALPSSLSEAVPSSLEALRPPSGVEVASNDASDCTIK